MFNVHFAGHLTRPLEHQTNGTWIASIQGYDGKAARLYVRRQRFIDRLRLLQKGDPLSGTGALRVVPTINDNGEARAFLNINVENLVTLEAGDE